MRARRSPRRSRWVAASGDVATAGGSQVRGEHQLRGQLLQRWRRRGTAQPERIGGSKRAALAARGEPLRALVAAAPDLTIAELRSRLAAEGVAVSRPVSAGSSPRRG